MGNGTNYTGNPTAVESPSAAPGPGVAPIVYLPSNLDGSDWGNVYQALKALADYVAYGTQFGSAGAAFGDGSDGNLTFDGVSTVLGIAPSSGVYYLTRDIFAKNCTVTGASAVVNTHGYRIFCNGILTTSSGGKITNNGTSGAGTTGGGGAIGNTVGSGGNAANYQSSAGASANALGGSGGAGGGVGAGSGGSASGVPAGYSSPRAFSAPSMGILFAGSNYPISFRGGSGGGGGNSGGGGGGGGVVCIAARQISLANASDIQAAGGNGYVDGGGGGGGVVLIAYGSKNAVTFSAATNCPGGSSSGGTAGSNGAVYEVPLG